MYEEPESNSLLRVMLISYLPKWALLLFNYNIDVEKKE